MLYYHSSFLILCKVLPLSSKSKQENKATLEKDFTTYSFMLLTKASPLNDAFSSWIQKTFDCKIHPLQLCPKQMHNLVGISLSSDWKNLLARFIELRFELPIGIKEIRFINLKLQGPGLSEIYDQLEFELHEANLAQKAIDFSYKGELFMKLIYQYFEKHFHLDLRATNLCHLSNFCVTISMHGKLNVRQTNTLS